MSAKRITMKVKSCKLLLGLVFIFTLFLSHLLRNDITNTPVSNNDNTLKKQGLPHLPDTANNINGCEPLNINHKVRIEEWIFHVQTILSSHNFSNHLTLLSPCLHHLALRLVKFKEALLSTELKLNDDERLALIVSLQRRYFSPIEIEIWFKEENLWHQHTLERLAILSNPSLSEALKQTLIDDHISTLSESTQQIIHRAQTLSLLHPQWTIMNYNQFADDYGTEAAERLIKVQEQNNEWQQRVSQFKKARQDILQSTDFTAQKAQLSTLKSTLFSKKEQLRLEVILAHSD